MQSRYPAREPRRRRPARPTVRVGPLATAVPVTTCPWRVVAGFLSDTNPAGWRQRRWRARSGDVGWRSGRWSRSTHRRQCAPPRRRSAPARRRQRRARVAIADAGRRGRDAVSCPCCVMPDFWSVLDWKPVLVWRSPPSLSNDADWSEQAPRRASVGSTSWIMADHPRYLPAARP